MVDLVRGKQIVPVDGEALRREAGLHERVVVDLGTGDGRFAYRLAQEHPTWFVLAVDANADGMREQSFRACRKPSRGGVANVRFVRAAVEHLPPAFTGIADEAYVLFPWGSLLRAVIVPDPRILCQIARLGKPGARIHLRLNASIFADAALVAGLGLPALLEEDTEARLVPAYAAAGIRVVQWDWGPGDPATSWGRRLGTGRPLTVLDVEGTVD